MQPTDDEDQRTDGDGDRAQGLAEFTQSSLQRGQVLGIFVENLGDLAHLGLHRCSNDDPFTSAVCNECRHEGHVGFVADRGLRILVDGIGILVRWDGLPRQGGFFDLQVHRFEKPQIRGYVSSSIQDDDISGYDLVGGNLDDFAVPPHQCRRSGHLLQRFYRLFGFVLLGDADDRVQYDDEQDNDRIHILAYDERDQRCSEENIDEPIFKLREEKRD